MIKTFKRHTSNSSSNDDNDDDDGVDCPLSGPEALAVCKEFASITNTDTGLAMMMLQQNGWDLQRALAAYQGLSNNKSKSKRTKSTTVENDNPTTAKPRFKLLSWNIDGLDEQEHTIETRTQGVIDVIKRYLFS